MNLRGIANGATRAVNPNIAATVRVSAGTTPIRTASRVPKFDQIPFTAQVQALQYNDMVHLDGLNIQGIRRAIYLNGSIDGINRINKKGGDIVTIATGRRTPDRGWSHSFSSSGPIGARSQLRCRPNNADRHAFRKCRVRGTSVVPAVRPAGGSGAIQGLDRGESADGRVDARRQRADRARRSGPWP